MNLPNPVKRDALSGAAHRVGYPLGDGFVAKTSRCDDAAVGSDADERDLPAPRRDARPVWGRRGTSRACVPWQRARASRRWPARACGRLRLPDVRRRVRSHTRRTRCGFGSHDGCGCRSRAAAHLHGSRRARPLDAAAVSRFLREHGRPSDLSRHRRGNTPRLPCRSTETLDRYTEAPMRRAPESVRWRTSLWNVVNS